MDTCTVLVQVQYSTCYKYKYLYCTLLVPTLENENHENKCVETADLFRQESSKNNPPMYKESYSTVPYPVHMQEPNSPVSQFECVPTRSKPRVIDREIRVCYSTVKAPSSR